MKGLKTTLVSILAVGLLAGSAVGVALAHDDVPEGAKEILAGIWPKWVADHPDPNSLELEEGLGPPAFGLYEHPDVPGVAVLPDEAWCEWASSYMNDDDGRATAAGVQACLDHIVVSPFAGSVVPASVLGDILEPPFYPRPLEAPVIQTGESEEDGGPFLLEAHVDYRVGIEAPPDCAFFWLRLRPQGAPEGERRTVADGDIVGFDHDELTVWDISTPCEEGGWTITIGEVTGDHP